MKARGAVNPTRMAAVAVCAVCLTVGGWIWFGRADASRGARRSAAPQMWYTIDDGKTWFADVANKVVPYDHQGKQAHRCFVWTCDGGKTKFVSHLERLSATGRRAFVGKDRIDPLELVPGSEEVKQPLTGDDGGWMPGTSPQAQSLRIPQCPNGKGGTPEAVWPQ